MDHKPPQPFRSAKVSFAFGVLVPALLSYFFVGFQPITEEVASALTALSAVVQGLMLSLMNAAILFGFYHFNPAKIPSQNLALMVLGCALSQYVEFIARGFPLSFMVITFVMQIGLFALTYKRFVRYVRTKEQPESPPNDKAK